MTLPILVNSPNDFARLNKHNYWVLKTPFQVRVCNSVSPHAHTVRRLEIVPRTPIPQADESQTCYSGASIGHLGHSLHYLKIINYFLRAMLQ